MYVRMHACMHVYMHTCMHTQGAQPDPKTQHSTQPQAAQRQESDAVTEDAAGALTGAPLCPARPPPPPATDGHALDAGMRAQYPKLSAVLWGAGGERGARRAREASDQNATAAELDAWKDEMLFGANPSSVGCLGGRVPPDAVSAGAVLQAAGSSSSVANASYTMQLLGHTNPPPQAGMTFEQGGKRYEYQEVEEMVTEYVEVEVEEEVWEYQWQSDLQPADLVVGARHSADSVSVPPQPGVSALGLQTAPAPAAKHTPLPPQMPPPRAEGPAHNLQSSQRFDPGFFSSLIQPPQPLPQPQ